MLNQRINTGLAHILSLVAIGLSVNAVQASPGFTFASSHSSGRGRGQPSINYRRRVRLSHAGKPAGYVKA